MMTLMVGEPVLWEAVRAARLGPTTTIFLSPITITMKKDMQMMILGLRQRTSSELKSDPFEW
jgi:hypothetical protein